MSKYHSTLPEPWRLVLVILIGVFMVVSFIIIYITSYCKARRIGPSSRFPAQSFNAPDMKVFNWPPTTDRHLKSDVKVFCGEILTQPRQYNAYDDNLKRVNKIVKWIFDLDRRDLESNYRDLSPYTCTQCLPNDARIVCIRMENFVHGQLSHEFLPIDGITSGSYFTYRTNGTKRIQVTNYVKDGVSYIAGVCIYIDSQYTLSASYRMGVIRQLFGEQRAQRRMKQWNGNSFEPTIQQEASVESETVPLQCLTEEDPDWEVQYCSRLRREVMTCMKYGSVIHQEWNAFENQMRKDKCETCTEKMNDSPPNYSSIFIG